MNSTFWTQLVAVIASVALLLSSQAALHAQSASLRIVVLDGEGAVNIIQQKTAVAPVVEVRDRNDQPVAGVVVRFAIRGGRATVNGARTLSVTTNAAGRAAAGNLTPLTSGSVQIQASATYQGQTVTATISQTNVATTAQAAAAGAAAGTAGGAAAGVAGGGVAAAGGLGALAITGIALGGGGAALVAAKAVGVLGGDCVVTISPSSFSVSSQGATIVVPVGLQPPGCDPPGWSTTRDQFFTFTGGGRGSDPLELFVAVNGSGNPVRTGTAVVMGQTLTVTQGAPCLFIVSPTSVTFPRGGGSVVLSVIPTPTGCDTPAWTAGTITRSVSLSPTSGSGIGAVTASAAPIVSLPNSPVIPLTGNLSIAFVIVPFSQ